ncbi:translation elongation factor EF1B/ribosomal protein S6 family protein [Tasmannia lanceolata]|uniref:translation elongation factor EF1B/ribosomal protein S6 family protein n=1 Tax=Tasmannia lanceolata TaxID=3420 RepID=UPI004062B05B
MEVLIHTCFSPKSFRFPEGERIIIEQKNYSSAFANGFSSPRPFSTQKLSIDARERKSVIAKAKKKKTDSHSFVSRPDEATGPFPEAVLLKKRKVREDGRVLPEFADSEEEKLFEFLNLQLESDLNVDQMRHYEVVYLVHEDRVDEVGSIISKVEDFMREKNGKIWRLNNWGLRRLAYKIRKAKNASYILMNFELGAKWINDFKSMLDKDERIIRHLVIKRDEAITEDCPPPPEFHTLRADGMEDDDLDDYDEDDDEQGWDDESDDKDVENGVIFVGEDDDEEEMNDGTDGVRKGARRTLSAEKIAR